MSTSQVWRPKKIKFEKLDPSDAADVSPVLSRQLNSLSKLGQDLNKLKASFKQRVQ